MNYNAENRTPRDRIGEELFSHVGDMSVQSYGIRENIPAPSAMPTAAISRIGTQSSCSRGRVTASNASMDTSALQRSNCAYAGNTSRSAGGCSCGRSGNAGKTPCTKRTFDRCKVHGEDSLAGLPLAMAYVPMQEWRNLYDLEGGFDRGTLFKELDFPFYPTACPGKGCRR